MSIWISVVFAHTETEYEKEHRELLRGTPPHSFIYISSTWLVHKAKNAWTYGCNIFDTMGICQHLELERSLGNQEVDVCVDW